MQGLEREVSHQAKSLFNQKLRRTVVNVEIRSSVACEVSPRNKPPPVVGGTRSPDLSE